MPAENGAPPRTLPSLWELLNADTARTGGADGGTQRSRPPVSTAVLSLIHDVRRTTEQRLRQAGRQPITRTRTISDEHTRHLAGATPDCTVLVIWRDIPAELQAINQLTTEPERTEWAERLASWTHKAKAVLGLLPTRIQLPRGTRCMDCGQAWVVAIEDGEEVRRPAVHLVWQDTGALHYVACTACGSSRWPHDLHALAAAQANLNAGHDTLALGHMDDNQSQRVTSPTHGTRVPKAR